MKLAILTLLTVLASFSIAVPVFEACNSFGVALSNNQYHLLGKCFETRRAGQSNLRRRDWVNTYVNIHNCIVNDNGTLRKQRFGGFSPSCRSCVIESNSVWLNCDCRNNAGVYGRRRLDLNTFIEGGNNGKMYCVGLGLGLE